MADDYKQLFNGLTNDAGLLRTAITEIAERMNVERLRQLYITALVWETRDKQTNK